MPRFALLITSLGRSAPLHRLLASLENQTCHDFKVFLGDQSGGCLKGVARDHPGIDLELFSLPRRGVSHARNQLTRHALAASPQYIAYPDDDCWYEPDTLEQAAATFAHDSALDGIVGVWSDCSGNIRAQPSARLNSFSAFRRAETYTQFYRAELVGKIGDWDECLGPGTGLPYGCGEDTDFLLRAIKLGANIRRISTVHVLHPLPSLDMSMAPRWRSYALGRMRVLQKHGFPLYFRLANVAYPLLRLPLEGPRRWPYRLAMFRWRLSGLRSGKWRKSQD